VAGHAPGDSPDDRVEAALRRHVLRMEVSAETFATFREAMGKLRREAGESIDDDAALLLLARQVLGGPDDDGRASYQVALIVCEACSKGWQQGRGDQVSVGPEVVEMAACDAQHLGNIDTEGCTHVGATADMSAAQQVRARQDIPPAMRRRVMRRDGGRCKVPGCRHATFVDIHHLDLRSEGGAHDEDNLVVLCSAHHRAFHRGQLLISGRVSTSLRFQHADGRGYGAEVHPTSVAAQGEAFRALRGLGFGEGEVRRALDRIRETAHVGARVEDVIRTALGVLTSSRGYKQVREPVQLTWS
jgi:5-methylcytosine-specific restriction endonuclease McrA